MESSSMIKLQLQAFGLLGMLPNKDSSKLYKSWGIVVFLTGGIGFVLCEMISVFYVQSTDDLVKELLLLVTSTTVAIKLLLFHLNREHLISLLSILEKIDEKVGRLQENRIMANVYKNSRRITIVFFVLYMGSLSSLFLELPFLERNERTWKSTALVPNDFAQSNFYNLLIFEIIANTFNCLICFAIDSNSLIIMNLLCGHIDVLALQIRQLGTQQGRSNAISVHRFRRLQLKEFIDDYEMLTM